jgi:aminoglycoside phosphotransferase (APT) family kinase protein
VGLTGIYRTASAASAATAAAALVEAASAALGKGVGLDGPPEVVPGGFGAGAWSCRLAGSPPAPWDAPVVVRVGATVAAARREAAWAAACAAHGFATPPVLAVVEDGDDAALVLATGPPRTLVEVLGENPMAIPDLLRGMAALHAGLRRVPVSAAPAGAPSPTVDPPLAVLDRALAAAGVANRFVAERAWLDAHTPEPGPPVVCHGDFQPASVRLAAGDPAAAVAVDWSSARLADPEYDLALTALMFWSVPYLAEGIAQRKVLKGVREMLIDGYRASYEATPPAGPLDDGRLRYWGAYHALAWAARLAAAEARGGPADPWDPVVLVHHPASYRKDLARRLARLTRG